MNDPRNVDRAWELMKKIDFVMLVTRDGDKLRARPMSAYIEREENAIYLLTDARRHKDDEIARNPSINLSFADASSQKYVSLTGTAAVLNDREYLERAIEFEKMAASEENGAFKAQLLNQAADYRRLAAKRATEYGLPMPSPPEN